MDYYKALELSKSASSEDIKKAYRKLARKYHPDLNPNDKVAEQRFKEISEAYDVLSHEENRKKYDKYGDDWRHAETIEKAAQQQRQQYQYSGAGSGPHVGPEDYSDIFESMFGGARGGGRQPKFRGQDLNAVLNLKLSDVYKPQKQTLQVNGQSINLTFPPGIEDGHIIKVAGRGAPGFNGGPNGDLYITFAIENDTPFRREGSSLYADVDLDLYTAILGGEIRVNTMDGSVNLPVTPGTANGAKVRVRGKGFPVYKKDGTFGDLFVTYRVQLPTNLSEKEKQLFTELREIRSNGK